MKLKLHIEYEEHGKQFFNKIEELITHFQSYMLYQKSTDLTLAQQALSEVEEEFTLAIESCERGIKFIVLGDQIIPITDYISDDSIKSVSTPDEQVDSTEVTTD